MDALWEYLLRLGPGLLLVALCILVWASQIFALPGNWVVLLLTLLFGWYEGFEAVTGWLLITGALLAGLGELAEFLGGWHGARISGGSRWTGVAALVGSVVGAVVGAAFGYGLGAIPGTVLGAFAGALLAETVQRQHHADALRRGFWAGVGRAFGLAAKLGFGAAFLALLALRLAWAALPR